MMFGDCNFVATLSVISVLKEAIKIYRASLLASLALPQIYNDLITKDYKSLYIKILINLMKFKFNRIF